jgi:GNAT superfamily N-acetyltransferase
METPDDAQRTVDVLEEKIYEFNSSAIGRHDGRLFSRVVRDGNGRVIAGVAGWTWASACEITQLWVSEDARKRGIGRMLLAAAEEEARTSKCSVVLVKTYSFQAPLFYERHGYRPVQTIEDFPTGCRYFALIKTLAGCRA